MTGNMLALLMEQEEAEAEEAEACPSCGQTPCELDWDEDFPDEDPDWCDACQGPCTL